MNFANMFEMLNEVQPVEDISNEVLQQNEPSFRLTSSSNWHDEFSGLKASPQLYNLDGYISPYASNNWGASSECLKSILDDGSRLPALNDSKIDPNKVFNSDISALKALAADQQRITKMFEKKLIEGLSEKGKVGLTEVDIEAMQALTSARSAITSINKEQINIKKNIADIRIKQNQQTLKQASPTSNNNIDDVKNGASSYDVGRSILDSLFDSPSINTPPTNINMDPNSFVTQTEDSASTVIDGIVSNVGGVNTYTQYESTTPTTYVVMSRHGSDSDYEFETYTESGELIPDYPKPNTKITSIDRDSGTCIDDLLIQYPIKFID